MTGSSKGKPVQQEVDLTRTDGPPTDRADVRVVREGVEAGAWGTLAKFFNFGVQLRDPSGALVIPMSFLLMTVAVLLVAITFAVIFTTTPPGSPAPWVCLAVAFAAAAFAAAAWRRIAPRPAPHREQPRAVRPAPRVRSRAGDKRRPGGR